MREVYIISAVRTPIGAFGGSLASLSATQLAAHAIKAAVFRAGIDADLIQELFLGNVLQANLGQAPATQAAKFAGLADIPATTINKVCASGLKAVMLAAQAITSGDIDIAVAAGTESMSNVPFYVDKMRSGLKLGHGQLIDGLLKDGLWDVYNDFHMGTAAERCACDYNISRQDQDAFAMESYKRSQKAWAEGSFADEIVEIELKSKKGESIVVFEDEEPSNVNFEKVPALKPVFEKEGTITAANASTLNDGAAALILVSAEKLAELNLKPLAKVLSYADAQQLPEHFTTAPSRAIPKALEKAGIDIAGVDYFEINEAFSAVSLVNNRLLDIAPEKVNVKGGAVSLGHPLGASGARILVTLCHILRQHKAKIGVAGICNGGGGASAMVIENV